MVQPSGWSGRLGGNGANISGFHEKLGRKQQRNGGSMIIRPLKYIEIRCVIDVISCSYMFLYVLVKQDQSKVSWIHPNRGCGFSKAVPGLLQ